MDDHSQVIYQSYSAEDDVKLSTKWLEVHLLYRAYVFDGILYFERLLREGRYRIDLSDPTRRNAEEELLEDIVIEHVYPTRTRERSSSPSPAQLEWYILTMFLIPIYYHVRLVDANIFTVIS